MGLKKVEKEGSSWRMFRLSSISIQVFQRHEHKEVYPHIF